MRNDIRVAILSISILFESLGCAVAQEERAPSELEADAGGRGGAGDGDPAADPRTSYEEAVSKQSEALMRNEGSTAKSACDTALETCNIQLKACNRCISTWSVLAGFACGGDCFGARASCELAAQICSL
jgi:hypothetical protein